MDYFSLFKLFLIPFIAGVLTQIIKLIIRFIREKKFSWRYIDDYGGMPSAHAAFLASLATVVAFSEGINSGAFAIVFILGMIMLRDAVGVRMQVEQQGKIILNMIKKLPEQEKKSLEIIHLDQRFGHTYPEAIVGLALGIGMGILFYYLF